VKLSIIVPVYNVKAYLSRCLESIRKQSFTDFECILINDGSTDNSEEICQEYCDKDSRFVLISQENKGVSAARNKGLDIAKGEWIGFIDADDYVTEDFYAFMLEHADEGYEMIECGVKTVDDEGNEKPHLQNDKIGNQRMILDQEGMYRCFLHPGYRFLHWAPWNKIIRADIAKKYRFAEGKKHGEDFYYCFECMKEYRNILYLPDQKYMYYQRKNSAVHTGIFDMTSFESLDFAEKAYQSLDDPVIKRYAEMNMAVNAARTIRGYKTRQHENTKEIKEGILHCKDIIRHISKEARKDIPQKQKILLAEASYADWFFKIR